MDKIHTILSLLANIGMPATQQSELCALTLLAMADIGEDDEFISATNRWIRIHDVIEFIRISYGRNYAENSRETFRKQAMHHFRTAALIEDNGQATNSPNYRYRITDEFLQVIRSLTDTSIGSSALADFRQKHESLKDIYASKKVMEKMPVRINNSDYTFSPGTHNQLQKAILEEFAPRFAPNSQCLYVGDTTRKDMVKDEEKLAELGFDITLHDKMPDVVLYKEDKNWIYFIEAVDSVGPMSPARVLDINDMTKDVTAGKIFVTAFLSVNKYKRFIDQLAWETEVWIAEMPDHMIHLNGNKFLGPR